MFRCEYSDRVWHVDEPLRMVHLGRSPCHAISGQVLSLNCVTRVTTPITAGDQNQLPRDFVTKFKELSVKQLPRDCMTKSKELSVGTGPCGIVGSMDDADPAYAINPSVVRCMDTTALNTKNARPRAGPEYNVLLSLQRSTEPPQRSFRRP